MAEPAIEVLGVYRVRATDELLHEKIELWHGRDAIPRGEARIAAEYYCREEIESAVLIEVIVRNRDERFEVGDFAQRREGVTHDNWQVAWAEAFLTSDGTALAVKRWERAPETGDLRIAFFIHYWDSSKPLISSYGDIPCPMPAPMPERLQKLVPYENTD
jgi:hypothetical protein